MAQFSDPFDTLVELAAGAGHVPCEPMAGSRPERRRQLSPDECVPQG